MKCENRQFNIKAIYRCGLHSGFRRCCIRWFIRHWLAHLSGTKVLSQEVTNATKAYREQTGAQYIACPECIALGRPAVKVLGCPKPLRGTCRDFVGRREGASS